MAGRKSERCSRARSARPPTSFRTKTPRKGSFALYSVVSDQYPVSIMRPMPTKRTEKVIEYSRGDAVSKIVKDFLKYRKKGTVLDVGAGTGKNSVFLSEKGFVVTALDRDRAALQALKKEAKSRGLRIKTRLQSFSDFKASHQYDIVLANNALHFLTPGRVAATIRRLKAATRSGGLHVISVHTSKNAPGSRPYLFKPGELKKYYSDWNILAYEEKLGKPFRPSPGARAVQKHRAAVIAEKPSA